MHLACILAISFLLSAPTAPQQNPSGNADAASQAPAAAPAALDQPSTVDTPKSAKPDAVPKKTQLVKSASSTPGKAGQAKPSKAKTNQVKASGATSGTKSGMRGPAAPGGKPRKLVVREGSTSEPREQIAPGMSQEQARHQRQSTVQLLDSTDNNLKQIAGRTLDANQQATVGQIRSYIAAARSALTGGDPERAHNLAFKAHLLSDDLLKH